MIPEIHHFLLWRFPGFELALVSGTAGQQVREGSSTGVRVFHVLGAADVRCCKQKFYEKRVVGEGESLLSGELGGSTLPSQHTGQAEEKERLTEQKILVCAMSACHREFSS